MVNNLNQDPANSPQAKKKMVKNIKKFYMKKFNKVIAGKSINIEQKMI